MSRDPNNLFYQIAFIRQLPEQRGALVILDNGYALSVQQLAQDLPFSADETALADVFRLESEPNWPDTFEIAVLTPDQHGELAINKSVLERVMDISLPDSVLAGMTPEAVEVVLLKLTALPTHENNCPNIALLNHVRHAQPLKPLELQ